MTLRIIDIHSHNNLEPLYEKCDEVFSRMRDEGVGTITVGTTLATSQLAIELAEKNADICWATAGIHPCDIPTPTLPEGEGAAPGYMTGSGKKIKELLVQAKEMRKNQTSAEGLLWEQLYELARHPKVVAIGETGLDYFHHDTPALRQEQEILFRKHIELALLVHKPLMLHVRSSRGSDDAYYDALKILAEYATSLSTTEGNIRANFHFFSGSQKCMEDIVAAGYTLSVDGPITFSRDYDEMIRAVPLDRIMVETDAPFAAPQPYRGKTCEPWMVKHVLEKIAEIKELPLEEVRIQILKNSQDFFKINQE